ncbi:hypothetical protein N7495_006505 [Penicillium taxi]|uniref:uncharacterized protein n=1 Tax=Penicillium taxi TaxID=168475 RepID=UPI0025458F30|nr:uncharacterized protein N7495_006505 [Penicillium taxi]KAJ5894814.1 hypothetical protein N7495_006505 [Penicillium taxi]
MFIMFTVSFATFTDILMYCLTVPVTPTALERKVGIAEDKAFSPVVGYLADRAQSRRWPLLLGLVALGAATALLCIGTHIGLWIAGRLFQGAASAVVWTVGVALMVDTVGKDGLGQAIGYVAMSLSLGTVIGPLLGGVLYEYGGYYSVFGLAFGFIGIDIFLRLVLIEKKHALPWIKPDEIPLPVSDQYDAEKAHTSNEVVSSVLVSSSVTTEENPLPRSSIRQLTSLLSSCRLIVSLWGYLVVSLMLSSFDSVLTIFVQEVFGWQQTGQGLIFIALMIPHLSDPITGMIIDRFPKSPRYLVSIAFLCAVPLATLLRLVKEKTMHDKIILCALLALLGLCIAVAMTPLIAEVSYAVQEREDQCPGIFGESGAMALAFGLSNMGFAAGSLVGPFFAGFIKQSAGWGTMGWAMGLIAGVSALPIFLFMGGWILRKPSATV